MLLIKNVCSVHTVYTVYTHLADLPFYVYLVGCDCFFIHLFYFRTEEKLCLFIDMMCKEFLKPKDTTITKEDFDMEENTRAMHQYPPKTMEVSVFVYLSVWQ